METAALELEQSPESVRESVSVSSSAAKNKPINKPSLGSSNKQLTESRERGGSRIRERSNSISSNIGNGTGKPSRASLSNTTNTNTNTNTSSIRGRSSSIGNTSSKSSTSSSTSSGKQNATMRKVSSSSTTTATAATGGVKATKTALKTAPLGPDNTTDTAATANTATATAIPTVPNSLNAVVAPIIVENKVSHEMVSMRDGSSPQDNIRTAAATTTVTATTTTPPEIEPHTAISKEEEYNTDIGNRNSDTPIQGNNMTATPNPNPNPSITHTKHTLMDKRDDKTTSTPILSSSSPTPNVTKSSVSSPTLMASRSQSLSQSRPSTTAPMTGIKPTRTATTGTTTGSGAGARGNKSTATTVKPPLGKQQASTIQHRTTTPTATSRTTRYTSQPSVTRSSSVGASAPNKGKMKVKMASTITKQKQISQHGTSKHTTDTEDRSILTLGPEEGGDEAEEGGGVGGVTVGGVDTVQIPTAVSYGDDSKTQRIEVVVVDI